MHFAVTNGGVHLVDVLVSQVGVTVYFAGFFLFLWSEKKHFTFLKISMSILSV